MSCGYPGRPLLVVIVKLNKGQPMAVVAGQRFCSKQITISTMVDNLSWSHDNLVGDRM